MAQKTSNQKRILSERLPDFELRLRAYSTLGKAALATGAAMGAMAMTTTTSAQIFDITSFNGSTPPTANGTGPTRHFQASTSLGKIGFQGTLSYHGFDNGRQEFMGPAAHGLAGQNDSASIFTRNELVKGGQFGSLHAVGMVLASVTSKGAPGRGHFIPNGANATKTGYVAFKQNVGGHTYYGWLRVKVTNGANAAPADLTFEADGNGVYGAFVSSTSPQLASFEAGQVSAIPEPANVASGLALLALGAAGVREFRRRQGRTAAAS